MGKKAISMLLTLTMVFSLAFGCITSVSALGPADVVSALPVVTGQPQNAVIAGTGSADFTIRTVFDDLLDQILAGNFDLEAWISAMLGQGMDVETILTILEALGFDWTGILSGLQESGIDWETIFAALQSGGFNLEEILGALAQDPNFDLSEILGALTGESVDWTQILGSLAGGGSIDLQALLALLGNSGNLDWAAILTALQDRIGGGTMPAAAALSADAPQAAGVDTAQLTAALEQLLGDQLDPQIVAQIQAALNGDIPLDELIAALQAALGENADLGALIEALLAGGFDINDIIEALTNLGYTPDSILQALTGSLLSYQWYLRDGGQELSLADVQDANIYTGTASKTLTVTRQTAPAETEQYTYFCTVKFLDNTFSSKDAVLTITAPEKPVDPQKPDLNKQDHMAYIHGYGNGTVRPQAPITRAETAAIFYRLLTDESRAAFYTTTNAFSDVSAGSWYSTEVSTLARAGILNGYPDGTFRPSKAITRAEMAKIIAVFADLKDTKVTFKDIQGHWAQHYIELAAGNGWILGYPDGTFRPQQNITRAETVTMLNRVLERSSLTAANLLPGMITFTDVSATDWYYVAIQEAANSHEYTRSSLGVETWTKLTNAA